MAIASFVLGLVFLVWSLLGGVWMSALVGIIGIILSACARKQEASGFATAGLVLSIIGTVLGLLFYIACVSCANALSQIG